MIQKINHIATSEVACRIHRGCHEIGGNCVEVEADGKRIVLDVGLPLTEDQDVELPHIEGLRTFDPNLLGVFISHPHPDHYGLACQIGQDVPIYMGEAAIRIIRASSFFTPLPGLGGFEPRPLSDREPVTVGPFTMTPFLIDHSAYDSYCFLIEVGSKRIFYSGDLRAHGQRSHLFDELVSNPPSDIDVLICEGTQLGRDPDFAYPTEQSVANQMAQIFAETDGMCLVWCSSQNIDRLVSVYQAASKARRQLIVDMYTAEILRATGDGVLPRSVVKKLPVFLPQSQKSRIVREKAFHISNRYYPRRIYPEHLADAASNSVMIFRPSMLPDLLRADCLGGASLTSSVWSGYLQREKDRLVQMRHMGIEHHHVHTSGHATVDELRRFIAAFPNSRIVPIHLEDRDGFCELSGRVELRNDHEWWEV